MLTVADEHQDSTTRTPVATHVALREGSVWPAIRVALALTDMCMLGLGGTLAYLGRFGTGPFSVFGLQVGESRAPRMHFYATATMLYIVLTMVLLLTLGAYRRLRLFQGLAEYTLAFQATALAALLTEFASYLSYQQGPIARGWLLLIWPAGALSVGLGRFAFRRVIRALHRHAWLVQPALVVGAGRQGQLLEWHAWRAREEGLQVVGFVDDRVPRGTVLAGPLRVLGAIDDLPSLIAGYRVEHVLVAPGDLRDGDGLRVLQHALPTNAEVALAPDLFRTLTTDAQLRRLAGDMLLVVGKVRIAGVDALLKSLLDVIGALLLLTLTLPLWLLIALAIEVTSPGPLFTRYPALGKGGRPFQAIKFRATHSGGDLTAYPELVQRRRSGLPTRVHPDVTPLGRVLSRYSLDELPQVLNVLLRQMSLVGPYKISPDQVTLYGERQWALLTMRPGLTGVCQIYGRGELTVEERSLLDTEYVRTYTIWRDLHVLLSTVPAVLRGRGAY